MSYKIRDGKLVRRTAAEQAVIDQRKAVYFGQQGVVHPKSNKTKGSFAIVTGVQADRLMRLKSHACDMIFLILSYQNFRHRGKSFTMPTEQLAEDGFSRRTQGWALTQ